MINFDDLLNQAKEKQGGINFDNVMEQAKKKTVQPVKASVAPKALPRYSKAGEETTLSYQPTAEDKTMGKILPRAIVAGVAQAPLNIARAVPAIAAATLAEGGTSKRYEEANQYALKPVSAEQMAQAQRIAAFVPQMSYGSIGLGGIDEFISGTQRDIQALQTPGNRILAQAAMAAGQMAPVIATGGIAGAGAGYGVLGAQAYGQSFGEAIERGSDVKTAGQYAALSSALELSTEGLVGGIPGLGKGVLSKMIKTPSAVNLASKVGAKTAGTFLGKTASAVGRALSSKGGRLLVNALGEGSEEVIASALAPSIERSTIDPNATDATLAELADSFAVGGLLSAVLGVPSITLSTGKTVTKLDDIDTLTPSETKEIEDELYRLARESNIRKGKITPNLPTMESWDANTMANVRGLPLPKFQSKPLVNGILPRANVAQLQGGTSKFNKEVERNRRAKMLYRGMEEAELQNIANTGKIKSNNSYNFENQQGQTLFSSDKSYATSYAAGFAPKKIRDKFYNGAPSYVVEVSNAQDINMAMRKGLPERDMAKRPINKYTGLNEWSTYDEIPTSYITSIEELRYDKATDSITTKVYKGDEIKNLIPDYDPKEVNFPQEIFVTDKNTGVQFFNVPNFDGSPSQYFISSKNQDMFIDSQAEDQITKDFFKKKLGWTGEYAPTQPTQPLPRLLHKSPYAQAKGQREMPFSVFPGEAQTLPVAQRPLPQAAQTITQVKQAAQPTLEPINRPVQARTAETGTLPLVDDFAVSQKISRNAVMAQNIKDSVPIKAKLQSIASLVERKFTDTGEAIDKIGKITGDKSLYTYYNNARLSKQRASALISGEQTNINGDTVGKSLRDILDPIMERGEEYYRDFQEYMFNLHNIDRMALGKPVLEISTGDSARIAQRLLAKHPEFETLKNEVRGYLDNLIDWRVESGLWSAEQANELKRKYPNYVPSYRKLDSNLIENAYQGGVTVKKGLKTAIGSGKQLLPLHEQIAQQTFETVEAATKNRFALKLLQNTNDETRRYVSEIADPDVKNAFTFFKGGEKTSIAVGKDVLEGIEALKSKSKNELEIGMEKVNSKFKELITGWNPFFLVRNAARDLPDAGLYTKNLRAFAKAYPVAVKEILENGPLVRKYKALGGSGNSFFDYAKSMKKPNWLKQNTVGRIESLNEAMEMLPRLTEFIATLSRVDGEITYDDLMEAMYNAAEITVNFGRSGSWGKTLNSTFVPFFNPALQGTSKLIRKFQETKGVEQWTLLVLKAAMLGVAPSLLNAMVYDDDEDYKLLDNRVKDTNFLFKIGDDEFIKIPKGRVLSLFGAAAERTVRAVRGEEDAFAGLLTTAKEQVAPISPFESNIISPIVKTMRNETWYGGTIEPERLQNVRPSERYTEKTTSLSKAIISKVDKIADAINISPMKLDVLIDSYSGIIGDIAIPLLTPRAEQNILKRSFVVDSVTQNRISDDFYTAKQELTYKRNSKDGTMADDVANSYINVVTQKVYDNFAEIRKIENGIWTDKEKREKTRKYYKIINGLELEALSNLKKVTQTATKLSKTIEDYEELKRETNKEVFGAEHALSAYDPKVYQKAEGLNKSGIKYDTFYDVYFSVKDIKADYANGNPIAYTSSKKKKQVIDRLMKNYTEAQRRAVYKAFDISEKVW